MHEAEHFDAAVIGGGPAGTSAAIILAKAGKHVEMVVEVALTDIQAGQELTFVIKRGSIGKTTVTLQNAIGAQPVTVKTIEWSGIAGSTGENPKQFTVLSDAFMSAK